MAFSYFLRFVMRAFPAVFLRWRTRPRFFRIFLLVARLPSRTSSGLNCWAARAWLLASAAAAFLAFLALDAAFRLERRSSSSPSSSFAPSRPLGRLPDMASTSSCDSLMRVRGFSGCASTFRSALGILALAARSPSCCRTDRSCSASVLVGCQPPMSGSDSSRSAGASAAPPSFPRLAGSRKRSDMDIAPRCARASCFWAAAAAGASFAGFSAAVAFARLNRSRNVRRLADFAGSSRTPASPARGPAPLLCLASTSRPRFRSFFQPFVAFATEGPRRLSSGASVSWSSRSQTSWEITGCERTEPPSARRRT
mmetsp:Transcript_7749/g.21020  ORF Transcript_7749/g.21020 Transcript_7749/m.21020 type:complete len:311 (-) Transcript_7749:109-1041(-)